MLSPTIMVQGTASSVGKSLLVTALCRFFRREGVRVAPFKSQNMALNSAVTPDGFEIGRAQAVQAEAAGLRAAVEMNPILIKPEGASRAQVVVMGKPIGSMPALDYHAHAPQLKAIIAECLDTLRRQYELVIIEGAGSPAEVNLKDRDIVNMHVARVADAPVLLVGDIDRGGVFAAFVGTLELLEPDERARVAAFIVNKFRGDVALLQPGLDFLTQRTGKPVLGVVPYVTKLRIADEDSVSLEDRAGRKRPGREQLDIAVVRLPRISNYDDVEALEHEPGVVVRFVERPEEVRGADLVILPGSKGTASDLSWLRATGIARVIEERAESSEPVLGICGGCQMLGEVIEDPERVESAEPHTRGLGLLPLRARFGSTKNTAQVRMRARNPSFLASGGAEQQELSGYEIHMGVVEQTRAAPAPFAIVARNGEPVQLTDGAIDASGAVVGSMIHGLFENTAVRASLLTRLRTQKGILSEATRDAGIASKEAEYDRLEATLRAHVDRDLLRRIAKV
ncbi:MAG TPA: cobyric acid synthase [Polyangiaceae bacterium]